MDDYVSGGYYIVKAIPRPRDFSEVLPSNLLTMSGCFTPVVRDAIQLQWDNYENVKESIAEEARAFGIPQSDIPEWVRWAKAQHNANYLVFTEVEPALELRNRFITDASTHVVGIGLHTSLFESFESQLFKDVNKGLGLVELVEEKRPLQESGIFLAMSRWGSQELSSIHGYVTTPPTRRISVSALE
jgi:hypothetical protein